MPVVDILDRDGTLRWDAPGILEAALYFPREPDLRFGYEARWRAEHKDLLPSGKRLTKAMTHDPARAFGGKRLEAQRTLLRKRRVQIERIGTVLWLQLFCSREDPSNATASKVAWSLGQLDKRGEIRTSRSTLKRDRTEYRGVVHWCAAVSYQRRVFGGPLLCHPDIGPAGYTVYAALWDFIEVGLQFFAFARDSGWFASTQSFLRVRNLWTLPEDIKAIAPKRNIGWPDCHRIRQITPDSAILTTMERYDSTAYRT